MPSTPFEPSPESPWQVWRARAGAAAVVVVVALIVSASTNGFVGLAAAACAGCILWFVGPKLRTRLATHTMKIAVVHSGDGARKVVHQEASQASADILVVHVRGPLTFLSQGQILALVAGPPWPKFLLLELSGVPFVDAGGMDDLDYLSAFLELRGTRVVLVRASARAVQAIERAKLIDRFLGGRAYASIDNAIDVVGRAAGLSAGGRAVDPPVARPANALLM